MLNAVVDDINFDANGKVTGIKSGELNVNAPIVICDPSYTNADRLVPRGQVIRAICILNHPIPETNNAESV